MTRVKGNIDGHIWYAGTKVKEKQTKTRLVMKDNKIQERTQMYKAIHIRQVN